MGKELWETYERPEGRRGGGARKKLLLSCSDFTGVDFLGIYRDRRR